MNLILMLFQWMLFQWLRDGPTTGNAPTQVDLVWFMLWTVKNAYAIREAWDTPHRSWGSECRECLALSDNKKSKYRPCAQHKSFCSLK